MKKVVIILALIALAITAAVYIVKTAEATGFDKSAGNSRHLFDSPATIVY